MNITPLQAAFAAGLATVAALAMAALLTAVGKPARFEARVAALEAEAAATARQARGRGALQGLPGDGACPEASPEALQKVRAELTRMVSTGGLQLATVDVSPGGAAVSGLAPLRVRLEATGPYESSLAALAALSTLRPVLFVDTVDVVSKTSAVTLAVSGRVYCSVPD